MALPGRMRVRLRVGRVEGLFGRGRVAGVGLLLCILIVGIVVGVGADAGITCSWIIDHRQRPEILVGVRRE